VTIRRVSPSPPYTACVQPRRLQALSTALPLAHDEVNLLERRPQITATPQIPAPELLVDFDLQYAVILSVFMETKKSTASPSWTSALL